MVNDMRIRKSGRWTSVDYSDSSRLLNPEFHIKKYFEDFRLNFQDMERDSQALEERVLDFFRVVQATSLKPSASSSLCFACVKRKQEVLIRQEKTSFFSSLKAYILSFLTNYLPSMRSVCSSDSKATMTSEDCKTCDCDNYPEITQKELGQIVARVTREEKSSS